MKRGAPSSMTFSKNRMIFKKLNNKLAKKWTRAIWFNFKNKKEINVILNIFLFCLIKILKAKIFFFKLIE